MVLTEAITLWAPLLMAVDSGSTGALGALQPTADTVIAVPADGVLHYTHIKIPAGITVSFARNAANTGVVLLATEAVVISGILDVSGAGPTGGVGAFAAVGGLAGPGGGDGGSALVGGGALSGLGAAGGGSHATCRGAGGGSWIRASGAGACPCAVIPEDVTGFELPLTGGSGGGAADGDAGGGGGGFVVVASNVSIRVEGAIRARGGVGGPKGGSGGGGAVRLVAPLIDGAGELDTRAPDCEARCDAATCGAPGLVRLEADEVDPGLVGRITAAFSVGPPGPIDLGRSVRILSVAGQSPAASAAHGHLLDPVAVNDGTSVAILVEGRGISAGAPVVLVVMPSDGRRLRYVAPCTGTPACTASFSVPRPALSGAAALQALVEQP